jgi:transposase
MAYSTDFRERVLQYCDNGEAAINVAERFGVSRNTIKKWQDLRNKTGSVQKPPLIRTFRKLDPQKVKEFFDAKPDALQKEAAQALGVGKTTIQKDLRKIKYKRKKKLFCTKREMNKNGKNS